MAESAHIERIRGSLRSTCDLAEAGVTESSLARLRRDGSLVRLAPGRYIGGGVWRRLRQEDRLLARTLTCAMDARAHEPVFSHYSAAVIWGLPLYRHEDERVHTILPDGLRMGSNSVVMRHASTISADEIACVAGLHVTSLSRTILDLAAVASPELALGCADAGLRLLLGGQPAVIAVEQWREVQRERLGRLAGHRGVRAARRIVDLADPRSDSVIESVSRLQLMRLGLRVEIQVPVPGPGGRQYRVDFELLDHGTYGEVDGAAKYLDAEMRNGLSAEQVVLREKRREDWIRGSQNKRVIRWGAAQVVSPDALAATLRAFGLVLVRRRPAARRMRDW